ncbi:MAG: polysaccharide deacetylase family protein [Gemmatimonadota bacterium]
MLATALAWLPSSPAPVGAQSADVRDRRVALTFDDLPMTGGSGCDAERVRAVTEALTGELDARGLPAAGLATPGRACLTRDLLRETLGRWREIGAIVGNHTATHPDLNTTPIEAYLADVERGQRLIDAAVETDGHWFRHPYLHAGDESDKKAALSAYLAANGYRVAPVTVDNQEWVYAAVYAAARERGDAGLARRVVDGYIEHLEECMAYYERLSRDVFGREIPQVLLLHANLLNAERLDRVLDMLEERGYRFVGLPEALTDPAYAREDTYVGPRGLSWLQRWAREDGVAIPPEPREAGWVADAFQAIQARGEAGTRHRPANR